MQTKGVSPVQKFHNPAPKAELKPTSPTQKPETEAFDWRRIKPHRLDERLMHVPDFMASWAQTLRALGPVERPQGLRAAEKLQPLTSETHHVPKLPYMPEPPAQHGQAQGVSDSKMAIVSTTEPVLCSLPKKKAQ